MTFELIVQAVLLGLLQGGVYALVACGLTLIYGVMKIVNFAHAEFLTLGMYLAMAAFHLGASPYLAALPIFGAGYGRWHSTFTDSPRVATPSN